MTPRPEPDPELERRLRDALRDEADSVSPSADAWTDFIARLPDAGAVSSAIPQPDETGVGEPDPAGSRSVAAGVARGPRRPSRAWRLPLVAAAAVVAIAVVAGLAVHRSRSGDAAGQSPAACGSAAMVWVPVDVTGGMQVSPGDGRAATSAAKGAATSSAGAAPSSGTQTATPMATLGMGFGATPPEAPLCVRPVGPADELLGAFHSDHTPLGYLSMLKVGSGRLLVAAVGPGVAQVQVQAIPSVAAMSSQTRSWASMMTASTRVTTNIDPGFAIASEMWIIDGGEGTPWSDAGTTTRWTDLGDGWHGFALAVPEDAVTADATALGTNGAFTQVRRIDLITGATSDQTPPVGTGSPLPGSRSESSSLSPVAESVVGSPTSTSTASSTSPVAVPGASGMDASECADSADGLGMSDVGFGLAGVEFRRDTLGGLCLLDASTGASSYAPQRAGAISNAAITAPGTVIDQVSAKQSTARFVWGTVTSDVVSLRSKAEDGVAVAVSGGLVEWGGSRVFLIQAPATGAVTLTAIGGSGQTIDTVTLP